MFIGKLVNKNDIFSSSLATFCYSINQKPEHMSKEMDFYHSPEIYLTNMENYYWI